MKVTGFNRDTLREGDRGSVDFFNSRTIINDDIVLDVRLKLEAA